MSRTKRRFYFDEPMGAEPDRVVTLSPEESHHLARVLRAAPGEAIEIFDSEGAAWRAVLVDVSPRGATARLDERLTEASGLEGPPVNIGLVLVKRRAMDWVVEKLSEIGVARLQPLLARRCVAAGEMKPGEPCPDRWGRLALAAAKQCGRNLPLKLDAPEKLAAWIENHRGEPVAYAHFEPDAPSLARWLEDAPGAQPVWILIGPEGGWDPADLDILRGGGAGAVTLGPLVLRAETAALAAACLARLRD